MPIVLLVIVGAAAGFLATRMMKLETNVVVTVAIGICGALVGAMILRLLTSLLPVAFGFIGAIVGAVILIWLWQTYFGKGD